jgi:tetratricopeptide (TPR) repeat protein
LRSGLFGVEPEIAEVAPEERVDAEPVEVPDGIVSEAVRARITAEFLSEDERRVLRVEHGAWTDADLADPVLAVRAAVIAGAWDHPAVLGDGGEGIERAEAAAMRGDAGAALELLDGQDGVRAERVRGMALEMLGRFDEAAEAYGRAVRATGDEAESVRAGLALLRLRGPAGFGSRDAEAVNRRLLERITAARDTQRLDWRARAVEAELLYARHNRGEAMAAAQEALRLNPRNAAAMRIVGEIAVDGFDFDTAGAVADAMDLAAALGGEVRVTADAAAIRARGALRRRDPAGAEMALDPALGRMGEQRELRAMEIAATAAGFRFAGVERMLADFEALSPGSAEALMWVGRTLSEARQYGEADGYLTRAIERAPFWSHPRLERGLMLVQAGEDEAALAELEKALGLDPFDIRAQNSLTLVRELLTYETIETPHFVVRYKDGIDAALAPEMAAALEAMHERVVSDGPGGSDHMPGRKTIVELMPNHEWFAVRIGGMPSIHTMAASTGPVIAIESPQVGPKFTVGPFDWRRVMQHEYTHTVNLSRTKNRIIHWLTEANAVFNEDAPRDMRTWRQLAAAHASDGLFDLEEINIAFVRPKRPEDRGLAYAQGAWMFEFLVDRWGAAMPRAIMDLSAAGRSGPEAFEEALGMSPGAFRDAFIAWAGAQLVREGLALPEGVPGLVELLAEALGEAPEGMPEEGVIDSLLEVHPDHPELLEFKIGFALSRAEERLTDEQIGLLERMMDVRPSDDAPHRRLARHYLAGETFAERAKAVEHLEFLDVREINSPAYAAELAELYAKLGDRERAFAKAERASGIAPFDANQREQAARMALLAGDRAAAERHLVALTIIEPDREIHRRRLGALRGME